MSLYNYENDQIIYALATGWANTPIGVIRISGVSSIEKVSTIFSRGKALTKAASHTAHYGTLIDPKTKAKIDEVLITVFTGGRGYTGQESLEISCHGSPVGIRAIFRALESLGFRSALPGEFTFRAFMNGKLDLTQAEAIMEIINSESSLSHSLALNRLEGNLFDQIDLIKQDILDSVSVIELQLDYAEDEIIDSTDFPTQLVEKSVKALENLIETYSVSQLYSQEQKVVLVGSTNVGKSTLFNLLLKEERSIVSDIHGTTRDFIESKTVLDSIPIHLYDTAGLRDSGDSIEQEGIKRSKRLIEVADLILFMVDSSNFENNFNSLEQEIISDSRTLVVWNKTDLNGNAPLKGSFPLSAKKGEGFKNLKEAMIKKLTKEVKKPHQEAVVIESERQKRELERSLGALEKALQYNSQNVPLDFIAVELNEALDALGTLTGEVASSDILENIFSNFCVGK
jgi:tRNA modification GTPase